MYFRQTSGHCSTRHIDLVSQLNYFALLFFLGIKLGHEASFLLGDWDSDETRVLGKHIVNYSIDQILR